MKNIYSFKITFLLIIILIISCNGKTKWENEIGRSCRLILDTDMESDVDDVGALSMLHALADSGEVEILGVMVCAKNPWSILCADRINTYYKREDILLGQLRRQGINRESRYAKQVAKEFPGTIESFEDAMDAVEQYRRILVSQPDSSVTILTIGYLTNLRDLLSSDPDEYSKLSGRDLVSQKVSNWICMGGMFPSGREANIRWDIEASVEVINKLMMHLPR